MAFSGVPFGVYAFIALSSQLLGGVGGGTEKAPTLVSVCLREEGIPHSLGSCWLFASLSLDARQWYPY